MLSALALVKWSETEAARLLLLPLGTGVGPLRLLYGALAGDDGQILDPSPTSSPCTSQC